MAHRTFTREKLHKLVWSHKTSVLAKRLKLPEAELTAACLEANIPVPPESFWSPKPKKKYAGLILPAMKPGQSQHVTLGYPRLTQPCKVTSVDDAQELVEPVFAESIDEFRSRVKQCLGPVKAGTAFEGVTHPRIAEELRSLCHQTAHSGVRLDQAPEYRRLSIFNPILVVGTRHGFRFGWRKGGREIEIWSEEGHYCKFRVETRSEMFRNTRHAAYRLTNSNTPKNALTLWLTRSEEHYQDKPGKPIEERIPEIILHLIVRSEESRRDTRYFDPYREEVLRREKAEEDRIREAKAQRDRLEAIHQAAIQRLCDQADQFNRAKHIRSYVSAVIAASVEAEVAKATLEAWAALALEHADRLDPVRSGAFLDGLEDLIQRTRSTATEG